MGRRFVSFGIGGSRWCLPVAAVVQIVRNENVHDLPHARPPVAGVITLHSDVVPVLDLRERLAVESPADGTGGAKKRRILVVRLDGRPYGILVDEVRELVDLEEGRDTGTRTPLPGVRRRVRLPGRGDAADPRHRPGDGDRRRPDGMSGDRSPEELVGEAERRCQDLVESLQLLAGDSAATARHRRARARAGSGSPVGRWGTG